MLSPQTKHLAIRNARQVQDEILRAAALRMTIESLRSQRRNRKD